MPSDKMHDILPSLATLEAGKGALDTRRFRRGNSYPNTELESCGFVPRDEVVSKPETMEVDACQRLSHYIPGKAGNQKMT